MPLASNISAWGKSVTGSYPKDAFSFTPMPNISDQELKRFVRLWLLEGIPFCFSDMPMLYEAAREYLGEGVGVDAGHVGMIGSARLGFSLAPNTPLKDFEPGTSDIDMFLVSSSIWMKLSEEYLEGVRCWDENPDAVSANASAHFSRNRITMKRHQARFFIDSNKIPVIRPLYVPSMTLRCEIFARRTEDQLRANGVNIAKSKRPFLRVFRDWNSAIDQNVRNLRAFITQSQTASGHLQVSRGSL